MSYITIEIDENDSPAADQMDFEIQEHSSTAQIDEQVVDDVQVVDDEQVGDTTKEHVMNKTLLQMVLSKKQVHLVSNFVSPLNIRIIVFPIQSLAQRWVAFYLESPTAALVSLLQFVVEASGSQYQIPEDTSMPFSYSDIISNSSLHFPNTSIYPLIRKPADVFKQKVGSFLKALLLVANEIPLELYDIFLTEMTNFVLVCSDSTTRAFRHTGTMIGLKIMTILSDLKSSDDEVAQTVWMRMFNSMFQVRRQDMVNEIRLLCLFELGQWLSRYPQCYIQPPSLRIFYESLKNGSGKVRQCSMDNISVLCRKDELFPQCVALATEFREILLDLCVDKEDEIAEKSLRLLTDFYKFAPEMLSDGVCQLLEQLIMAANRGLAQAAVDLFILRRNGLEGESFSQRIQHLLQFFVESEHEQADHFVDSLFNNCKIVLDWKSMIAVLMENPRCQQLSDIYCSSLIAILLAGVKQATTGEIPPGRYTNDLKREPIRGAQEIATKLLAPVLPELLQKYANRVEDIERLLELPMYFCLEYYRVGNRMEQLSELFEQFDIILFNQTSSTLLQTGVQTLAFLNRMIPNSHTKHFLIGAVTNYKMAWQRMQDLGSTESPQNWSNRLLVTLRLLTILSGHFDLTEWQLTEPLLFSLKRLVSSRRMPDGTDLPPEALSLYLKASFCCLAWDMENLKETAFGNEGLEEYCAALNQNLEDYLFVTFSLVGSGHTEPLAYPCFSYTCDLFVLHGNLCGSSNPSIRSVAHVPSGNEVDILESFLMENFLELSPADLMKESNSDQLQRIRAILTSYLKLVCLGVMPSMRASKFYKYYVKYHAPFGDVMRCSLELAIQVNPVHLAMTLLHTCLLLYMEIFADDNAAGQMPLRSPEFSELMELANRLSKILIPNPMEYRECVIGFHRSGIMFVFEATQKQNAVASKKLPFLRVLKVFAPLLLAQDKVAILTYFQGFEQLVIPKCNRKDLKYLKDYRTALSPRKTKCYSAAT
ncbi:cohesin subunit SA-3 isoform X1 [Drosophila yakuba]|uniref:cohesin subunit SA-3 isoform X1 n=1 Tax=Drosophila yakuba TaxID=7245 RepID=UPI0019308566|nr:cohesin subunit SA-3 isoform X1 [Drosophila yakuba]